MFRTISIAAFVVVLGGIALHFLLRKPRFGDVFGPDRCACLDLLRLIVLPFSLLFIEQKMSPAGVLRKLVFLLALLCFVVLAITGFVPRIFLGKQIWGYWLMLHATAAPVFSACMAILAVMWGHNCRLDKSYWPWLNTILRRKPESAAVPQKYELTLKILFWVILVLVLPVILSAVLSMFRFFGTAGQEFLANLHRYCTLALALSVIIYLYLTVLAQMTKMAAK
jgi:cytochrome b subunit of formate dehydrogenase